MMPRWGRTLTTGLTINGAAFSTQLLEWGHTFSEFWGRLQKTGAHQMQKIMAGRDL